MKKILLLSLLLIANVSYASPDIHDLGTKCSRGEGVACGKLGFIYFEGKEIKQSYRKAREYFEKGCSLDEENSCGALGVFYTVGVGVRQSFSQAKKYYSKACVLGSDAACSYYVKLNKAGH